METTEKKEKTKMIKIETPILILIEEDVEILFHRVFEWSESNGDRVGKLNIWDEPAPFFFIFNKELLKPYNKRGFKGCYYIDNYFTKEYTSNNKMFLRAVEKKYARYRLIYHPLLNERDIKNIDYLIKNKHEVYEALSELGDHGEAFEVIQIK